MERGAIRLDGVTDNDFGIGNAGCGIRGPGIFGVLLRELEAGDLAVRSHSVGPDQGRESDEDANLED